MKNELEWLISQAPKEDLVESNEKINYIFTTIQKLKPDQYPYTFGLFGSWGSGKTTMLSFISKDKRSGNYNPIYFNAWKYAGTSDITSILIYRILNRLTELNPVTEADFKITRIIIALGNKHKNEIGEWLKDYVGINPLDLIKNYKDLDKTVKDFKHNREAIDVYHTQTDKAQDLLQDFFKEVETPLMIFIDELDRCDPNEAFDLIKRLRVFFGMKELPVIFIISVNPDPIGMAIRHQYGLNDEAGAYETNRILEKFVDDYIDMSQPILLDKFVRELWNKSSKKIKDSSFVHALEDISENKEYSEETVKNSTSLQAISTNNPYYNNLRVLSKSYKYVSSGQDKNRHLWTIWHLEILKQCNKKLRSDVARIASDIRHIA